MTDFSQAAFDALAAGENARAALRIFLHAARAAGVDIGRYTVGHRHAVLDATERRALPAEYFALPEKRELPIRDADHVREAWDMVDRTEGLTDAERALARRRILARAHALGIDTAGWTK